MSFARETDYETREIFLQFTGRDFDELTPHWVSELVTDSRSAATESPLHAIKHSHPEPINYQLAHLTLNYTSTLSHPTQFPTERSISNQKEELIPPH